MIRRSIAIVLTLIMVLSLTPMYGHAEGFSDMPENWSTDALEKAVENGLLQGFDGKIMPSKNLTRAEMATVINRSFGAYQEASLLSFDDMDETRWYYEEMAKAVHMRTFQGDGKNLNPDNNITRQEAFAVLARALKLSPSQIRPTGFTDLGEIATWATGELYAMINAGYVKGSSNKINPKANITRAEFAQVMDNVIKLYVREEGIVDEVVEGNIMVNAPGVEFKDVTISGDLIVGDGVGDGNLTLNNTIIEGRLVVRGGGENSIIIKGNSEVTSIIIARVDGVVRVYNEAGIEIGEVIVDGADDVILEGDFTNVTILAPNVDVYAVSANVEIATIEGSSSKLIVDIDSNIGTVVIEAGGVTVEGEGQVDSVQVNSGGDDAVITTTNTVIDVVVGVENVTGTGSVVVEPGLEYKNAATVTAPAQPVQPVTPPIIVGPTPPPAVKYVSSYINDVTTTPTLIGGEYVFELPLGTEVSVLSLTMDKEITSYKVTLAEGIYIENGLLNGITDLTIPVDSIVKSNSNKTLTMSLGSLARKLTSGRIDDWGNGEGAVEILVRINNETNVTFLLKGEPQVTDK